MQNHLAKAQQMLNSERFWAPMLLMLNAWLQSMCKQRGFTYADYFSATVDAEGFLKSEFANDGLHPNADGYRVMGPVAQSAIDRTLVPSTKKRGRKSS